MVAVASDPSSAAASGAAAAAGGDAGAAIKPAPGTMRFVLEPTPILEFVLEPVLELERLNGLSLLIEDVFFSSVGAGSRRTKNVMSPVVLFMMSDAAESSDTGVPFTSMTTSLMSTLPEAATRPPALIAATAGADRKGKCAIQWAGSVEGGCGDSLLLRQHSAVR